MQGVWYSFKLHFSYLMNRRLTLRIYLHDGRQDDLDVYWKKSLRELTPRHFCDVIWNPSINSLSLENNVVFCSIVHWKLFQYIKIIPPRISYWQSGMIWKRLIQQIAHSAFDPFRVRQHFPCDSNFYNINNLWKKRIQVKIIVIVNRIDQKRLTG